MSSSSLPTTATSPSLHSSSHLQLPSLTQRIAEVQEEIKEVKQEIKQAIEEIKKYKPEDKLWTYWSDEKSKLRDLLTELSKKENLLLQQQQQQASVTAAATSQAFPVVIAVNTLLDRLQRDIPRRPSSSADSSSCMTATAVEHSNPCSAIVEHDDSSSLANVDCSGCLWKPGRRSLTRHSASLPMCGIPVAEFGSYLKFVNREQQCEALVTHLQTSYFTFLQRIQTPEVERGGPGDYLKAIQVIYSAGAPGVGKTTWARMALDHIPTTCVFDARFRPVLDRCTQRGWRYRICFGEDMVTTQELAMPNLSLAARLLWQHVKYELPRVSSVQSYDVFWRYLYDHHLTFATADVLKHICGSDVPVADRMLLVNLDEVNVLFPDHGAAATNSPQSEYLQHFLRHLLQLQIDGVGFVVPVLTATKALRVREIIRLSGCAFREIPLPLLTAPYVHDLVRDLLTRARQVIGKADARDSVTAASTALAHLELGSSQQEDDPCDALPPLLLNLLELMAGHPRFLEKLLFRLGRPEGAAEVWLASTFAGHMAQLQCPVPPASAVLESWLGAVSTDILNRYTAFKQYLFRPEFVAIAPQLLGYTLFEWSVSREQEFREKEFGCTVQQLEEDGVVFLSPKPFSVNIAGSASSVACSDLPDVELRLVMPFLWLHVLYERHAVDYASSVVQLPLVKTLTCRLSPAQNEELTLSVLALKCFCFAKRGVAFVSSHKLFGLDPGPQPDVQLRLPLLDATQWATVKLRHQVTAKNWDDWYAAQRRRLSDRDRDRDRRDGVHTSTPERSPPHPHFFLNGEKAPFWDSCVLTDPPIFVQDKQSLVARGRVAHGQLPSDGRWADVVREMEKCRLQHLDPAPLFLFCTDDTMAGRPREMPKRVAVIDRDSHAAFFGPVLASRKAMCLSELEAPSATR